MTFLSASSEFHCRYCDDLISLWMYRRWALCEACEAHEWALREVPAMLPPPGWENAV